MTSITNYTLASMFASKDNATSTTSQNAANPSLADVLSNASGLPKSKDSATSGNSYLLDLSDSARAYLQNLNGSGGTSAGSATSANGNGIVLTNPQRDKLNAILEKYKDAPFTDATFQKIQADMEQAGIAADKLAAQNQMRRINPTLMLINALSGGDGSVGTVGGSADIKTETQNFMGKVLDQWRAVSTTAKDEGSEDPILKT